MVFKFDHFLKVDYVYKGVEDLVIWIHDDCKTANSTNGFIHTHTSTIHIITVNIKTTVGATS